MFVTNNSHLLQLEEFGKFGDMEGADPRIKKFSLFSVDYIN